MKLFILIPVLQQIKKKMIFHELPFPLTSVNRMCDRWLVLTHIFSPTIAHIMEHEPPKHRFTRFYVTTTVESRRNFRIIMEAFTVYCLSLEIVILTNRQITNQNNFAHGMLEFTLYDNMLKKKMTTEITG